MKRKYTKYGLSSLASGIGLVALALASNQLLALADSGQSGVSQGLWFVKLILFSGALLIAIALICFVLAVSRSEN